MRSDKSDGHGLVDRGPRRETTMDMSPGRLLKVDPGANVPRRDLTPGEKRWLRAGDRTDTLVTNNAEGGWA